MAYNKKIMILSLLALVGAGGGSSLFALTTKQRADLLNNIRTALSAKKLNEAEGFIKQLEAAGSAYKKDVDTYKSQLDAARAAARQSGFPPPPPPVQRPVQPGQFPPPPPVQPVVPGQVIVPVPPPLPPVQPGPQPQQQGASGAQRLIDKIVEKADELRKHPTFGIPGRVGIAPEMEKTDREKMHAELLKRQREFAQRAELARMRVQEAQQQDPYSTQTLKESLQLLVNNATMYTNANIAITRNIELGQLVTEKMINDFLENTDQIQLQLGGAELMISGKQLNQEEADLFNQLQQKAVWAAEFASKLLEYAFGQQEAQQEAQQKAAEEWKKNKDRWYNIIFKGKIQELAEAFDLDPQQVWQMMDPIKDDPQVSDAEFGLDIIDFFVTQAEDSSHSDVARKAFLGAAEDWLNSESLVNAIAKDTRAGLQEEYQGRIKDLKDRKQKVEVSLSVEAVPLD